MKIKAILSMLLASMACISISASADSAVLGDINGDSVVNVTDVSLAAAQVKSVKPLNDNALLSADVNGDDIVNVTDISLIAAHVKSIKLLGDEGSDATSDNNGGWDPNDDAWNDLPDDGDSVVWGSDDSDNGGGGTNADDIYDTDGWDDLDPDVPWVL